MGLTFSTCANRKLPHPSGHRTPFAKRLVLRFEQLRRAQRKMEVACLEGERALRLREHPPSSPGFPNIKGHRLASCGRRTLPANRHARIAAEMDLARTFVSFSSTDIRRYHMMCAWKAHEHIDFNFADTLVLLIGADTYRKTDFVEPEVEAAIEKGCRLIGVNLTNCRFQGWDLPLVLRRQGRAVCAVLVAHPRRGAQVEQGHADPKGTQMTGTSTTRYTRISVTHWSATPPYYHRRQIPSPAGTGHRGRNEPGPEFSDGNRSLQSVIASGGGCCSPRQFI
jgi:hypothetical protein